MSAHWHAPHRPSTGRDDPHWRLVALVLVAIIVIGAALVGYGISGAMVP